VFADGDSEIADGVTLHRIGGHSRGLQALRVRTRAGWMVLASDAAHFYENLWARKPFPIVVDLQDMLDGFDRLEALASRRDLVVPGHDPAVRRLFPQDRAPHIFRLDGGPSGPVFA
jgi:glyoxylase-like metal-dependent hydrolase (beta-lactamase superfamily II)